jgi:hypothetical protein
MSSLDTAAPFAYHSSTLIYARFSLFDLLAPPQQNQSTLNTSASTFVKGLPPEIPRKFFLLLPPSHTLCHLAPKAMIGFSLSSDLSTALAIQVSPLVSTPNLSFDSSFHQVLLICILPKPITTPILVKDTSEQVKDASTVKTSLPAIVCFHPCVISIILIASNLNTKAVS